MQPLRVECEREDDGRWLAEIPELPGVMAYGDTREEAIRTRTTQVLAFKVVADNLEHGESIPPAFHWLFSVPEDHR